VRELTLVGKLQLDRNSAGAVGLEFPCLRQGVELQQRFSSMSRTRKWINRNDRREAGCFRARDPLT